MVQVLSSYIFYSDISQSRLYSCYLWLSWPHWRLYAQRTKSMCHKWLLFAGKRLVTYWKYSKAITRCFFPLDNLSVNTGKVLTKILNCKSFTHYVRIVWYLSYFALFRKDINDKSGIGYEKILFMPCINIQSTKGFTAGLITWCPCDVSLWIKPISYWWSVLMSYFKFCLYVP